MRHIVILGSTGSIGTQALDVIREHGDHFTVKALAAGRNAELLAKQALEFKPKYVCIDDKSKVAYLEEKLAGQDIEIVSGDDGLVEISTISSADMVLVSIVGVRALLPTIKAIEAGKDIALASKEILVAAGKIVMDLARKHDVSFLPVDSEHAAVMQCLCCNSKKEVENITLTASGGPFFGKSREEIEKTSLKDALNHPNWSMGQKITIDSASLMNKGLEVIEAHWLFGVPYEKIDVVVHRESLIHSMVNFNDGSTIAQLGAPDMRIPIQYALCYPNRPTASWPRVDLIKAGKMTFYEPDMETFECLKLAYVAGKKGGTAPVVLNAANEVAVELFLNEKIDFFDIPEIIKKALAYHDYIAEPTLEEIIKTDQNTRDFILVNY